MLAAVHNFYTFFHTGIVRPPTAGTKETPDYELGSNVLKSRAAMFEQGKGKEYQPRNRIKKEDVQVAVSCFGFCLVVSETRVNLC